jgi:hypothetical protein
MTAARPLLETVGSKVAKWPSEANLSMLIDIASTPFCKSLKNHFHDWQYAMAVPMDVKICGICSI